MIPFTRRSNPYLDFTQISGKICGLCHMKALDWICKDVLMWMQNYSLPWSSKYPNSALAAHCRSLNQLGWWWPRGKGVTHPSASRVFRTKFSHMACVGQGGVWIKSAPKLILRKVIAKNMFELCHGQWHYCNWKWEIKCNYLKIEHQRDIRRCSECPSFYVTSASKASLMSLISESAVAAESLA